MGDLSAEAFSALTLRALDGVASDEELRMLEDELRRSADGARRREYVALAHLRGRLSELLNIPEDKTGLAHRVEPLSEPLSEALLSRSALQERF